MFVLILGGSKTGKSRYAEKLAVSLAKGRLLYLATMIPVGEGEEGAACIVRHRAQREGLGFTTIERPRGLAGLAYEPADTLLLEDVSNLLANGLFAADAPEADEEAALRDILAVKERCANLIAVSFHGLEESEAYDEPTNGYIAKLNVLNKKLLPYADAAVLMQNGVPTPLKGNLPL